MRLLAEHPVGGAHDAGARHPARHHDVVRRAEVGARVDRGTAGEDRHRDQLPLWLRRELAAVVTDFTRPVREGDEE
ncbi:hypothetical protein [Streptomyces sp. NPDC048643]|uniref:hypothetical protein n=1 Tax=Streptomyces sp. NPDC048643 TaxID=3155637 RepID=UPI0034310337